MSPPVAEGHVRIFDTTLRDGEQSPGASLTSDEKVVLARHIADLGVDIIEAGFPAASPDDLEAVRRIAEDIGLEEGPIITGLARTVRGDIERAWRAVEPASRPRIHTFLATSDVHLEHKLRMSRNQVVDRVGEMVEFARSLCRDVEFSPEDAGRSDVDFLIEVLTVAIQGGATTLNIPDTVGYLMPDEYGALMHRLIHQTPGGDNVVWSVHCHDDLGLATANSMAGIRAGARQAEVTINGIGERAGNTSLEEVVMAIETRRPLLGLSTQIDTRRIARTSEMVSHYTGMMVPPNKAIVGANAFAHEAGIHQDGMLKNQQTYEIMTPASVGRTRSRLVLGKHSGRHAFRIHLEDMGFELDDAAAEAAFQRFKSLADRQKTVTDHDLRALVDDQDSAVDERFQLLELNVSCAKPAPTATVRLADPQGREKVGAAVGSGSVHAIFRAIETLVGIPNVLIDYSVQNVTEGIDALGQVSVRLARRAGAEHTFYGFGADGDILVASAKAFLTAINRMLASTEPALTDQGAAALFGGQEEEPFHPHYTAGIP